MFNMHEGKQPCHIFLTGEKQVGKSTLVTKVLKQTELKFKGIRSISIFDSSNNRNVFIVPAEKENPELKYKAGVCINKHITEKYPDVFDTTGCNMIEPDSDTQLIIIDEIGNMEKDSSAYSEKILSLLDRTDIHILGVVQQMADTELASSIRKHPNVKMFVIKESNRDNLVPVVLRLLRCEQRF